MTYGLAERLIVGYWHNWTDSSNLALRDVPEEYDVVNISFATPVSQNDMTMEVMLFDKGGYFKTIQDAVADIAHLQARGTKVLISIGGANHPILLDSQTRKNNFLNSMIRIIETFGFDGFDIDVEGGSNLSPDVGDDDFTNPTTIKVINMIDAFNSIISHFSDSPNFIVSTAPETLYVQGGYNNSLGSGAYLPILHALRDHLTYMHVQHYNSGTMCALDGEMYADGTTDFHVSMAEMLLQGFSKNGVNGGTLFFDPFPPEKVLIGLPAANSRTGASSGYTSPTQVQKALNYLINGVPFGGHYQLINRQGYKDIRGLMTWSINEDKLNGWEFINSHRSYLDSI